ncbi:MAG: 6-pyruvoyl-tetrahydropterin synthase-related protein [Anaerolineae bacterium]
MSLACPLSSTWRRISSQLPRWAWGLAGVLLLGLPALIPLCQASYFSSHDGLLHLYRLMGLDGAMRAGVLYPRWFPDFAFGYGHPILNFYGPLSYYTAQWFRGLGLGLIPAMKAAYALAGLAAGAAMYAFAWESLRGRILPSAAAGAAYIYIPYHLADLYVRGAIAESLAFVWFPLILWGMERILQEKPGGTALLSLSLAGLIITHSLSLVFFGPFLAVYLLVTLVAHRRQAGRLIRGWFAAGLLGLGLSAFYWLPVLLESKYVGLAGGASAGYQRHLAPIASTLSPYFLYRYFPAQGTLAEHPAGLTASLLALAGLLLGLARIRRSSPRVLGLMTLAAAGGWFMTTTASLPLWKLGEALLSYLQYPWRFMALHALGAAWLAGAGISAIQDMLGARSARPIASAVGVAVPALIAISALARLPYQALALSDGAVTYPRMWAEEREVGQIGTSWTGEYLPIWVREQRWAIGRSWRDAGGPDPAEAGALRPPDSVRLLEVGYNRLDLAVESVLPASLVLHQFYFPGMAAYIDGKRTPAYPFGALGLAAADIPAGTHQVRWRFTPTPPRLWGTVISIVSLIIGIGRWIKPLSSLLRRKWGGLYLAGILAVLAPLVLPALTSRTNTAWENVQADFEGRAVLLASGRLATPITAGSQLPVALYWLARTGFAEDLVTFVHLTSPDGTVLLAQSDHEPDGGFTPTTRWLAGEIIPDRHVLDIPASLSPGRYALYGGIYSYPSLQLLSIRSAETPVHSGRVLLGYVEVRAP